MDHLAGLQLIPGNKFLTDMETYVSGRKLAVLINHKYNTPGSFKNLLDRFEASL